MKTYRVSVVLDPHYGKALFELSRKNHVWVCSSRGNLIAAKMIQKDQKTISIESGVTTFNVSDETKPEIALLGVIGDIDLHHGEYSHEPPWTEIEVIGLQPNEAIVERFKEYGAVSFMETAEGFIAKKNIPRNTAL